MSQTKSLVLLAGAALSLGGGNAVLAQSATNNDQVRAMVAEAISDAETRSSLLSGGDAGHDGRFFIAGDGFRLNVGGMIQLRYLLNFRDDANGDDFTPGFQARRTKLNFGGDINKDWFFRVEGDWESGDTENTGGSNFGLEDAYAGYRFANGTKATWGQFKLPLLREELVSDAKQLAVERSVTNNAFSQGWSQGIMVSKQDEGWRWALAFSDGLRSANTDLGAQESTNTFIVFGQADYAFTGRAEFLLGGNWDQFEDFTSKKGQDFGMLFGIATHYQSSPNTNQILNTILNTWESTIDFSMEGDSWNLYAAGIYRYDDSNSAFGGSEDSNDFGVVLQGGWRFAENTELFGRWDSIFPDSNWGFEDDSYSFITVGVNQYYAGHAAKGTLDFMYAIDATNDLNSNIGGADTTQGLLGDVSEGEFVFRFQFQLLF